MPLRQLSDSDYAALAQAAGLDVPPAEIARVHRLLAVDGYRPEQLVAETEQKIAALMSGWKHAKIAEHRNGKDSVVELAAVEVDEIPGRRANTSPRADCARRVREGTHRLNPLDRAAAPVSIRELCPLIDAFFYRQIEDSFPETWNVTRHQLVKERSEVESMAVETAAALKYEEWQRAELERRERGMTGMRAGGAMRADFEQHFAEKQAEIGRTWEQLTDRDREQYRQQAEEEWFVRER